MAAPALVSAANPLGNKMPDGWKFRITFGLMTTFSVWATEISPPAVEGGPALPYTTFLNSSFMTKRPQYLWEIEAFSFTGMYDPDYWKDTMYKVLVNRETNFTILWPTSSTWTAYGYVRRLAPQRAAKGTQPLMDVTVEVTNWDYINKTEAGPVYVDNSTGTADS